MECKNYWCAHWDYNKCSIEGNIVIDDNGKCITFDGESVRIKTVLERKEWQKKEEYGDLYDDTNKLF